MARRKASGTRKAAVSGKKSAVHARSRAKAKTAQRRSTAGNARAEVPAKGSAKRPAGSRAGGASPKTGRKPAARRASGSKVAGRGTVKGGAARRTHSKPARPARRREEDIVPTPPSSLNMNRHGSAARTGRAEIAEERADHATMTPAITGGDVDADVENAYFSGDEAPGGDNPTPDQDIVDDIGRALGVEYQDNEELRSSDKVADRDRHRWELDPASAEDYKDRK